MISFLCCGHFSLAGNADGSYINIYLDLHGVYGSFRAFYMAFYVMHRQFNLVCVREYIHWIYTVQCTLDQFYTNQALKCIC